ncbi:MAG: DUF3131 domain-containing protein [Thermoanaerobaculia bacterium]|nr:DUF3131 domain-containing protein [Thermoanaerobaculia bacterium]
MRAASEPEPESFEQGRASTARRPDGPDHGNPTGKFRGRRVGVAAAAIALTLLVGCSLPLLGPSSPRIPSVATDTAQVEECGIACTNCFQHLCGSVDLCENMYVAPPGGRHPGRNGPLTAVEMQMARIAWKYFENNLQETTGLVNAVNDYPSTTMWDTASYMAGMVAARELCIIDKHEFDRRMVAILATFNRMEFFRGELPNKVYNTQTAAKVDYGNQPGEIGFSALDLGRLLIWLRIIKERYPEHGNAIDRFIMRWNFCNVLDDCGTMYGAAVTDDGQVRYLQEGRLGYEEYAAKGFALWGFNTRRASLAEPYSTINLFDIHVPFDSRDPRVLGAHNYVVCESYVLDAIELNWDEPDDISSDDKTHTVPWIAEFAQRIYDVQEARYHHTGIITARTEHQLAEAPYFVYDTIYTDGFGWNTITEDGRYVPEHAAIALKGALGLWAVWETPYTDLLFDTISGLYDEEKGFFEGKYELSGDKIPTYTANNNGIMLESLLYKVQGKLLRFSGRVSVWDRTVEDEFQGQLKCFPRHKRGCGPGRTRGR